MADTDTPSTALAPRTPALDFKTGLVGTPIRIDGVIYEIRHPDMLPLGAIIRLEAMVPTLGPMMQRASQLSPEEEQVLSDDLRRLCADVLDAPADVLARLSDQQRLLVTQAFIQLRRGAPSSTGATTHEAPTDAPSSGKKSSRGSRGSMAERQTNGSGVSPSA
jgi:hypothetical protein